MNRERPKYNKDSPQEPFTQIPNRLIRSLRLDAYDKVVYCALASCNPSHPSYKVLRRWTGFSIDRIWKSLRRLEELKLITRIPHGKGIRYALFQRRDDDSWLPASTQLRRFRNTESTLPPHGNEPFRNTETINTKEKE